MKTTSDRRATAELLVALVEMAGTPELNRTHELRSFTADDDQPHPPFEVLKNTIEPRR